IVPQSVGKVESRFFRDVLAAAQKFLRAAPANLDPAEKVGFRARHLEDAFGLEMRVSPENQRVGTEAHFRSAAVGGSAKLCQLRFRLAALEYHAIERLLARDLDFHALGESVGNRHANAVQAA